MRRVLLLALILILTSTLLWSQQSSEVQFIFTSDSHFGIMRASFRGMENVESYVVNTAMVASMNRLPGVDFPADGGLRAGQPVGPVDFVADAGDIANREEKSSGATIQSAAASWSQFQSVYINGLTLLNRLGRRAPIYVVPGNHDASNAIGYYKTMAPATDKSSMAGIYNLMMSPAVPKTPATYDYSRDKIEVSHDIGGIHFVFLTIWPDSGARAWMENDLKHVGNNTPVIVFTHVPPDSDSKLFTNPNGKRDINATDKFENLMPDVFADDLNGARTTDAPPVVEQKAFAGFLRQHPNVMAYFHGHNNWNEFYDWTGPDHDVMLHTFRVDSPMKGHFSATDETKLSFQIATVNMVSRTMTVREVLWNAGSQHASDPVTWGDSTTVGLAPRPVPAK